MKKLKFLLPIAVVATMAVTSCKDKDDPAPTGGGGGVDTTELKVTQNISSDTKWTNDKVYILGGRITVTAGATLTIEPGTIIKGEAGTGANATCLLVARDARLMAEGTAELPIIFTSVADEITPEDVKNGNFASPNLDPTANGLWGGLIVLGNARISGSAAEIQIEGIPTSDQNGLYGGNNDGDTSGVIKYISIRHGGTNIGAGNEINGLTLGGVGSGTIIENVEVVANQDDGIEWFGGTVNVKNALVWNAGDDAIDTDQSWGGTLDNFIVITPTGHCFELDGPEGSYEAGHTIKNGTVVAATNVGEDNERLSEQLINTDANSIVNLQNIFFSAVAEGQVVNRTIGNPGVTYTNIVINIPSGVIDDYIGDGPAPAGIVAGNASSNKANASVFGWTWAAKAGATQGL